jgi:hypothetical protein
MYKRSVYSVAGYLAMSISVPAILAVSVRASVLPITIIEQSHHAWGHVEDVSYDMLDSVPVAGECSKVIGTDLVQIESDTLGSDADELRIYAHTTSQEDYIYGNRADAEVSYLFYPNATALTIAFEGTSGFHSFESGLTYLLRDVTTGDILDEKSWERELGSWVDDVLPYTSTYDVELSHTYSIAVGAYAELGDMREGFAQLAAIVTPEPSSLALLGIALTAAAGWRRSRN